MFRILHAEWNSLGQEDKDLVFEFIWVEFERGMNTEPGNGRLLASALPILQAATSSPEELDPLLQRLHLLGHDLFCQRYLLPGLHSICPGSP